ncbi:MAG TPA: hypothetical protein VHU83_15850 [Bryobacteraceae bacterium]|jgi:hypothetical protein|nr:hypothetical protein [Bryobacteraceae bacterium]
MPTESQIRANQQNAKHSTGPKSEEGKAASCMNNFRHGFTGEFRVLPSEDQDEFDRLAAALHAEHRPSTMTETILVERMAQSYWLSKRALYLQDQAHRAFGARCARIKEECCTDAESSLDQQQRQLALFIRYQTTNDRAFHKCLNDLLKLRAEKRKQEIGFESQRRHEADQSRKAAAEKRKQDLHEFAVLLAEAKVDHQFVLTSNARLDGIVASTRENIPLEVKKAA